MEERNIIFRLLRSIQEDFLEGGGCRGDRRARRTVITSHTCQPSCAQQRLEASALPSMTSPPKVKIGLSVPTRVRLTGGGGEEENRLSNPQKSVSRKRLRLGFRERTAFPEHLMHAEPLSG